MQKIGAVKAFRHDAAPPPPSYPPPAATFEMLDSLEHLPKSVRPPLSPHTEAELRQACLNVVRDYRPSHKIFPPTKAPNVWTAGGKRPFDHGSIQAVGPAGRSAPLPLPVSRANLFDDDRSQRSFDSEHHRNSMAIKIRHRASRMIHMASFLPQFSVLCFKHRNIPLHSLIRLLRLLHPLPQSKNISLAIL